MTRLDHAKLLYSSLIEAEHTTTDALIAKSDLLANALRAARAFGASPILTADTIAAMFDAVAVSHSALSGMVGVHQRLTDLKARVIPTVSVGGSGGKGGPEDVVWTGASLENAEAMQLQEAA